MKLEKRKRVAVYGNSLHMAAIAASLKVDPTLEVLCINIDSPDPCQCLDENELSAIVFDLSDPPLRLDIALLRDRPGVLLIGVDLAREEMLVVSSQPARALSMADLISVIHQREFPSTTIREEKPAVIHRS